jgi:hypothetical protein
VGEDQRAVIVLYEKEAGEIQSLFHIHPRIFFFDRVIVCAGVDGDWAPQEKPEATRTRNA